MHVPDPLHLMVHDVRASLHMPQEDCATTNFPLPIFSFVALVSANDPLLIRSHAHRARPNFIAVPLRLTKQQPTPYPNLWQRKPSILARQRTSRCWAAT